MPINNSDQIIVLDNCSTTPYALKCIKTCYEALEEAVKIPDAVIQRETIDKILSEFPKEYINLAVIPGVCLKHEAQDYMVTFNLLGYFCMRADPTIVLKLLIKFKKDIDLQIGAVKDDEQNTKISALELTTSKHSDGAKQIAKILYQNVVGKINDKTLFNALNNNHADIYIPHLQDLIKEKQENNAQTYPSDFLNIIYAAVENNLPHIIKNAINAGIDPNMVVVPEQGKTLLHFLCSHQNFRDPTKGPDLIRFVIEKGADVNVKNSANATPILFSVNRSKEECHCSKKNCNKIEKQKERCYSVSKEYTEILIAHGADIDCVDINNKTPLYFALQNHDFHTVTLLLDSCDDKASSDNNNNNTKPRSINFKRILINDNTYLMLAIGSSAFSDASKINLIKFLLDQQCPIDTLNIRGYSALHTAVLFHNEEALTLLLDHNANINVQSSPGTTPLDTAIEEQSIECAEILIDRGATISESIIKKAIDSKNLHLLLKLFVKLNTATERQSHLLALFNQFIIHCCKVGDTDSIGAFIANGYDINAGDPDNLPIFEACAHKQIKALRYFLENKAEVCVLNSKGESPLSIAFAGMNTEITQFLINGALHKQLQFALQNNHLALAKHILTYCNLQKMSEAEQIVFENILDLDEFTLVEIVLQKLETLGHLNTFIVNLCKTGKVSMLQRLIEMEYLQELINKLIEGKTLLYYACESGQLEVVKFLVANGAEVNKANSELAEKNTPLHVAAANGHVKVITFLLEHGANTAKLNALGETAFTAALIEQQEEAALQISDFEQQQSMGFSIFPQLKRYCEKGDKELLKAAEKFIKPFHYENQQNLLQMLCDSFNPSLEIVELLIGINKFDINERDLSNEGSSPLHLAIKKGNFKLVALLIKCKADVNRRTVQNGISPIQLAYACYNNGKQEIYRDIIKLLVENNADINPELISSDAKDTPAKKCLIEIIDNHSNNNNSKNNNVKTNPEAEKTNPKLKPHSPRLFQAPPNDTRPLNCSWANGSLDSSMAEIYFTCQQESILCNYCSPELREQLEREGRYELFKALIENPSKAIKFGQPGIKILKGLEHKVCIFDINGQIIKAAPTRELKQLHGNTENRLIGIIIPADNTEFHNNRPVRKAPLIVWYLDVPDLHVEASVKTIKDSISARVKHDNAKKISVPVKPAQENSISTTAVTTDTTDSTPTTNKNKNKKKKHKKPDTAETDTNNVSSTPTATPTFRNN